MIDIMAVLISKKNYSGSIKEVGFAVEYFPHYVNLKPQMHSVDVVLMSVIFAGRGFHYMDDAVFEESGASVAITDYLERHSIVTDKNGMEIMNIYLAPEYFDFSGLPEEVSSTISTFIPPGGKFRNPFNRLLRIEFGDIEKLKAPLFAIKRELQEKEMAFSENACAYFRIFLTECARRIKSSGLLRPFSTSPNPAIEKALRFLDSRYTKEITLEKIAKKSGYSKNHFCRAFRSYTGMTLYEYIINKRLRQAAWKLRNSDEKIFAIAFESGFNDISYFNRAFRKFTGSSPGEYRIKIRRHR